jgi:hypothetical protein
MLEWLIFCFSHEKALLDDINQLQRRVSTAMLQQDCIKGFGFQHLAQAAVRNINWMSGRVFSKRDTNE